MTDRACRSGPARRLLFPVILALFPALLPDAARAQEVTGGIRGSVFDKDFDSPVGQVRVTVPELLLTTVTGSDGHFVFERVPPGPYTISFARDGYQRQVLTGVVVTAGQYAELRVDLESEVVEMDEMVVTGADLLADSDLGLLEIRQSSVTMQDAISQELLKRSGATDLAGALKLVVGTSVSGGKYATVRGLSDRYTGTTLNGVRVPSADPRRRAVQIDQFPTGTIDTVTVTKTFTPDLLGDFTGGGVDIRTRSIPDGRMLTVSVSTEYNTLATRNDDFLTYDGGGVSALGRNDGSRDLPEETEKTLPTLPRFTARPTPAQMQASKEYDVYTRAFGPVIGVSQDAPGSNYSFSVTGGDRWSAGTGVVGFLGSLTTTHKYDFYADGENNTGGISVAGQPIGLTHRRVDNLGSDTLLLGALGTIVWRPRPGHELALRLILSQSLEDQARYQQDNTAYPTVEQNQSLHYTDRNVKSEQLHGTHAFADLFGGTVFSALDLDWVAAINTTRQNEPDVRYFRNLFDYSTLSGEMPHNSTEPQNTRRIFRDIEEDNTLGGFSVALPFHQWTDSEGRIKAGLMIDRTERDSTQRSFTYKFPNQFGPISNPPPALAYNRSISRFRTTDPEALWTDVFLDSDRIGLATNSPPAPNQLLWYIVPLGDDVDYTGDQAIDGYYVMGDLPVTARVKVIGGARRESTNLEVVPTNAQFGKVEIINVLPSGDREIVTVPQEQAVADIHTADLLPSLGVVWEVVPSMNLRASWARTIARPNFRELAPVATEEFLFGDEFIGNPALTLSHITNYDLRWEWFRRAGQVLTCGVFRKDLTDPIEMISFAAGGRSFVQPVNYERGRASGIEIEARTTLEGATGWLRGVGIGMNATLIRSAVEVPESERASLEPFGLAEDERRLQGQPAYVLNGTVSYDDHRTGTSGGLFYNIVGETLLTGAARGVDEGTPNVLECPFHSLDLRVSQPLKDGLSLTFKAVNILASERRSVYRTPEGEEAIKTLHDTARLFSVGVSWTW